MESSLYLMSYIFYSLFETYVLYKIMKVFLGKPKYNYEWVFVIYSFRFISGGLQFYYMPYAWLNLIMSISTLLILTVCYGNTIKKKVVAVVISFMSLIASETVIAAVCGICNMNISAEGHNGNEFSYIGMAIVFGIIYKLIACFRKDDNEVPIPKRFNVIIILVSVMLLFLVSALFLLENVSKSVKVISAICLLLILFVLMYLYDLMMINYSERLKAGMVEKEKQYYYKQIEIMRENNDKISRFRHDINNHLYVINEMIDERNESVKNYIQRLVDRVDNTKVYSKTGNIAIDSVINYKLSKAEDEQIEIRVNIILPPGLDGFTDGMVTIIGNLLDNAIEANRTVIKDRYIELDIKYKVGMVFIKVFNSYDGELNVCGGEIKTKKDNKELHGIGLKSVQSVVEEYTGTMDITYNDNQFGVKIVLYM